MATWTAPVVQQKKTSSEPKSVATLQPIIYNIPPTSASSSCEEITGQEVVKAHAQNHDDDHSNCPQQIELNTEQIEVSSPREHSKKLDLYSNLELRLDTGLAVSTESPRLANSQYVERHKALLKQKGFHLQELFSSNRSHGENIKQATGNNKQNIVAGDDEGLVDKKYTQLPDINDCNGPIRAHVHNEPIRGLLNHPIGTLMSCPTTEQEANDHLLRLPEIANSSMYYMNRSHRPDYEPINSSTYIVGDTDMTPGRRHKHRDYGRKLGNICSSERLLQLLDCKEPLRMENCYNYYL